MAVTMRTGASLTRRRFLSTAASSAAITAVGGIAKPYLSRAADRPLITHGVQSGDVSVDSGVVWARADRPSRMLVEVATTDSFRNIRSAVFVDALPETDFTAKALIEDLPAGQDIFYRIRFQDHSLPDRAERAAGRALSHRAERSPLGLVRLVGRYRGQGWGIDEARGGMRTYATMLRNAGRISSSIPATTSMPIARSRRSGSCRTARSGRTSSPRRNPRSPRRSRSFAATTNTTCSTGTCARSMPRCRCSRNGTITRSPTTGARARRSAGTATSTRASSCWRRAAAAPSTNSCRCAQTLAEAGRVYRKIPYGPLLDVFMLDMRSYRTRHRRGRGRPPRSSGRRRSPGSSAN